MVPQNRPGVYLITNTATDAVYVGSSAHSVVVRWRSHQYTLRKNKHGNPHLQHAWNKYGPDAFTFTVLEYIDDQAQVLIREQAWLDWYLNEWKGGECYNVHRTAGSPLGTKHSPEARARQSARMKGYRFSKDRARIIAEKISKVHLGLVDPNGVEYRNIKNLVAFCRQHGLSVKGIQDVDRGRRASWRGWRKVDSPLPKPMTSLFAFIAPNDTEYRDIPNLSAFCREHNLNLASMCQVYACQQPHHRGWRRIDSTFVGKYNFVAPNGSTYRNIVKLAPFCREHGLNKDAMSLVHNGHWHHHKGWRKAPCPP